MPGAAAPGKYTLNRRIPTSVDGHHRILNIVYFGSFLMTFCGSQFRLLVFLFLLFLQYHSILCSSRVIHCCEKFVVVEAAYRFHRSAAYVNLLIVCV